MGFQDYGSYLTERQAREAELRGETAAPAPARSENFNPAMPISNEVGPGATATAAAEPGTSGGAISDEQNFDAVSSRETIESDAARLERQRAAYEQIAPEPVPERSGSVGPNIVEYALATTNRIGETLYERGSVSETRHRRACARYGSADKAQEAFLAEGGPKRDRLDLDPDGDGFACGWNPRPFRMAVGRE